MGVGLYKVVVIVLYLATGMPDPHAVIVSADFDCLNVQALTRVAESVKADHPPGAQFAARNKVLCVDTIVNDADIFEREGRVQGPHRILTSPPKI